MSHQFEIAKQIVEETCPHRKLQLETYVCLPISFNARNITKGILFWVKVKYATTCYISNKDCYDSITSSTEKI